MSGLLILIVVAIWAAIGFALWKRFVRSRIQSSVKLVAVTLALAAIWFVGPVLDEILGAKSFERACAEMPEVKFHGPLAIGPGAFFDKQGTPRWTNMDEFLAIKRNSKDWRDLFDLRQDSTRLKTWPIPIFEIHTTDFARRTGQPVVESFYRTSPGGWIKRALEWHLQGSYQCPSTGRFPKDHEMVVFKAN